MSRVKKFMKFCNENVVMIAGISIIIGVHWGWSKLQNVPALVNPEEKKELPIFVGVKKLKELAENKYHDLAGGGPKES